MLSNQGCQGLQGKKLGEQLVHSPSDQGSIALCLVTVTYTGHINQNAMYPTACNIIHFFNTWSQFHQHSTSNFYQMPKKTGSCLFSALGSAHVKAARRTLMKMTLWVNFINILLKDFFVQKFVQSQTLGREKLLKRHSYKKCVRKMLMKMTLRLLF